MWRYYRGGRIWVVWKGLSRSIVLMFASCSGWIWTPDCPRWMERADVLQRRQPPWSAGGEQLRHPLPQIQRSLPERVLATCGEGLRRGGKLLSYQKTEHKLPESESFLFLLSAQSSGWIADLFSCFWSPLTLCNFSAHQSLSGSDRGKHHSLHHQENVWPLRHRESQRSHQAAGQERPVRAG